jgi:hypothetical protein
MFAQIKKYMIKIYMGFLAVFVLLIGTPAQSQSRKTIKDSSTVIIFAGSSTSSFTKKKKKDNAINVIKIAPLGFISGTFPILYERKITDYFTVQVSAGLTNRNYSRNAIQSAGSDENSNSLHIQSPWDNSYTVVSSMDAYGSDLRTAKMGTMFSIQPRFYFNSEAPEGSYLGLSINSYKYNFDIQGVTGSPTTTYKQNGAAKPEYDKITDFMVHFGNQVVYDRLTLDGSTEIGIRNVKGSRYSAATDASNTLHESNYTLTQNTFNFNFGIKVGYHF